MGTTMELALDFAERGWPVFPCLPDKRPLNGSNGFKDASTDKEVVAQAWIEHPDAPIGIATGHTMGSGLLVVDLDTYKAGGREAFDQLLGQLGIPALPETYHVRTGNGGDQYYYFIEEEVRSRNGLVENCDIKADGGYVIGAGSKSLYGEYELIDGREPVNCPPELIDYMKAQRELARQAEGLVQQIDRSKYTEKDLDRFTRYASKVFEAEVALLQECRDKAVKDLSQYKGPMWNETVFKVSCNLLEIVQSDWNDLTEDEAYKAVMDNAPRDRGFTERDVLTCWNSARRTVDGKFRPVPASQANEGFFIPFAGGQGERIDPESFFRKGEGLDTTGFAAAIMDMGPLAIDYTKNRSIWAYKNGVWSYSPHEISDRCAFLLGHKFRPNHVAVVTPMIQAILAADDEVIKCEPVETHINVLNGMLNWRTGVLEPHDPGFLSTVQLPVQWNPAATCPNFELFVKQVMAPDAIDYLWELLGYMVYSGNPFQKAILMHGEGSNGKGTLMRVIGGLLGDENTSSVTLQDISEGKFETASLFGRIANLAGDIDPTYMRSTAKFKAITGEDTVDAQRKYEHPFKFKCWAVPMFSANKLWKSVDTTVGYKRRWLLLPFPNTFPTTAGLTNNLLSELDGVLVMAVKHLRTLMARGDFSPPPSAMDAKDKFELAGDQVLQWLEEDDALVIKDPQNHQVHEQASRVYQAYRSWAVDNGHGTVNSQEFNSRLRQAGFADRKSGVRILMGFRLDMSKRDYLASASLVAPNVGFTTP